MGSTSSSHSRLISRSNSAVGVGNQGLDIEVQGSSIASSSHNRGSSSNDRGSSNLGGKMGSTSSSHSWLISRSNSTVGVGNQGLNVQVEGSSIASVAAAAPVVA